MIEVAVTYNRVLDLCRTKPEFLQAVDDLAFDRVVEEGIEHDDTIRRRDSPSRRSARCRGLRLSEEVEIVEHLHWLGVPLRTISDIWGRRRSHKCWITEC